MATRKEREDTPEESFDGGYHLYSQEKHRERVAKNADRVAYAIEMFKVNNIEYVLKNPTIGHFHCRTYHSDKLIQFWAGTGKILGRKERGIHNLIRILLNE